MYQPFSPDSRISNELWNVICNDLRDWLEQHGVQSLRPNMFNQFLLLGTDGRLINIPGLNKWANIYISGSGKVTFWLGSQPKQINLADPDYREKILNEIRINLSPSV